MTEQSLGVGPDYQIADELWAQMVQILPSPAPKKRLGRPWMNDRQAMTPILYVLSMGRHWNALPRSLGASSTVHSQVTGRAAGWWSAHTPR